MKLRLFLMETREMLGQKQSTNIPIHLLVDNKKFTTASWIGKMRIVKFKYHDQCGDLGILPKLPYEPNCFMLSFARISREKNA